MSCNLCPMPLKNVHLKKHNVKKRTAIAQYHRMSAQTVCLYNHNNKSILCLPVEKAAGSWCLGEAFNLPFPAVAGGRCTYFDQL